MNTDLTLFAAPHGDDAFVGLPQECQTAVLRRLAIMQRIAAAPRARREILAIVREHGGERGYTLGALQGIWYRWNREKTWECLLDKSKAGGRWWQTALTRELPEGFRQWLAEMWAPHQRGKFASAYQKIKRQYAAWLAGDKAARIPGFETPPRPAAHGMPAGWSYRNLMRIAKENFSVYARKLIQIGSHAAAAETFKVIKTREGLEVGEIYIIDDLKLDFRVLFRGKSADLRSFHVLDLFSACNVIRGYKPTYQDFSGVWKDLTEREMLYTLAALFGTIGYRPAGTCIYGEHGTATVRKEYAAALYLLSEGKITFKAGPAGGGPGVAGLYNGLAGGNPRWKAPIESSFNLVHNRTDNMLEFPGQTGSMNRVNDPEGLEEIEKTDEAVYRAAQLLTPQRRQEIQFNLLQYENAVPLHHAVIELINTRRDHDLQGWRNCGHYVPAFRLHASRPLMDARLISQLPPAYQEELRIRLKADPGLVGEIALSPREVFDGGASGLKKFTPNQTALFLAEGPGEEIEVKQGRLAYPCPEVDADEPLNYGPVLRTLRGTEIPFDNGEKFLVRVNHFDHRAAYIYDAKGGFMGVANYFGRAGYTDATALQGQFKAKARQVSVWTEGARRAARGITRRAAGVMENNLGVVRDQKSEVGDARQRAEAALGRLNAKIAGNQTA